MVSSYSTGKCLLPSNTLEFLNIGWGGTQNSSIIGNSSITSITSITSFSSSMLKGAYEYIVPLQGIVGAPPFEGVQKLGYLFGGPYKD